MRSEAKQVVHTVSVAPDPNRSFNLKPQYCVAYLDSVAIVEDNLIRIFHLLTIDICGILILAVGKIEYGALLRLVSLYLGMHATHVYVRGLYLYRCGR